MIRILDIILTTLGIIILMPFFIIIGILIKLNSKGPFLYKQERVGCKGIDFKVYKFRTMHVDSDKLGLLTVGGRDPRITKVGYYLRKLKLDELPQLFNVLFGNMSLVGPRPEVRKYVELYTFEQKKILLIQPGITDWASIVYRDENIILEKSLNPEKDYIQIILPDKIKYNLIFLNNYKVLEYLKILIFTFIKIINPKFTFKNFRQLFI
jgi:lipopolysaccharide/colanic/teichoic acid biosynthesis glycosyltransferase